MKIAPVLKLLALAQCLPFLAFAQTPLPIVDVHLHALPADHNGPPPLAFCLPMNRLPLHNAARPYAATFLAWHKEPHCPDPVWSPESGEEIMQETLEILDRRNVIGVTSGPMTDQYFDANPDRIIPGVMFSVGRNPPDIEKLRANIVSGRVQVIGEVTNQYDGIMPDDTRFAPYLALAEEHDVPLGIHVGPGPPGVTYFAAPSYRAGLHSPLHLEEVLTRHPKLRLYIMHAGWPMLDDTIAVLWAHPQVYVGLGILSFGLPPAEFHRYVRTLVEAGFGERIMFGSDQMVWPEALEFAIDNLETADYLSEAQKRNIFYNNAARFFRFSRKDIDRHHGQPVTGPAD